MVGIRDGGGESLLTTELPLDRVDDIRNDNGRIYLPLNSSSMGEKAHEMVMHIPMRGDGDTRRKCVNSQIYGMHN